MRGIHLLVLVLVAGAIIGVIVMQKNKESAPPALEGPPPDALFLEEGVSPGAVIESGRGGRASRFVGLWVKAPGWELGVEDMTSHDEGLALRMQISTSTPLYGSYWLVAVVPKGTDIRKGDHAFVTGYIDSVDDFQDGGTGGHRVLLKNAKVERVVGR